VNVRVLIQRAILPALRAGTYQRVTYDDGMPLIPDEGQEELVPPGSVLTNEIQTAFDVDDDHGRRYITSREVWQFEALMQFPCEVLMEDIEESLAFNPITVPATDTQRQALILYRGMVSVEHPTTHQGPGTKAVLRFDAILGRP